ncbi:MAG: polyphosphate kinase 1 [Pseudomonadota bacterium]
MNAANQSEILQPAGDAGGAQPDAGAPEHFVNRDLSLLEFNRRVLEHALDPDTPLLERVLFLCICCSNLDEYFEVRVSGVKKRAEFGSARPDPDGLSATQILAHISEAAHELVARQYLLLNEELLPSLESAGVRFLRREQWSAAQAEWIKRYFDEEVLALLTPMGLDPAHPFPMVLNKNLNFIVTLSGKDAFGRAIDRAIVQVPRSLPRLMMLPDEDPRQSRKDLVFLSSVIHAHVSDLFPGMEITGCYQFRVTRDADLLLDDEEVEDLMRALEGELPERRFGEEVRLEVDEKMPAELREFLRQQFSLSDDEVYQVNGPVNLGRLQAIYRMLNRPDLKHPPFTPGMPGRLGRSSNIFETIRAGDLLLHHPYESFSPVVELLRQAAADDNVLAIKQTLYRTGPNSVIVDALVDAARGGKEVTVIIELRARFDEEANIDLANRLHAAGAHVAYGVVGYKTHAKMLLVIRREAGELRRYAHLGTGNYHASTARLYTDFGLLTCDVEITQDVHKLFQQLTGLGKMSKLKKLLQSPFTLHKAMLQHIAREADHARAGKPARIIAKMNALTEREVIEALYRASQAGVQIDLIIRGACCLRPGIPGVSETIRVRSIVGRFLEHTRIFYFENNKDPQVFCASADWMDRNLHLRVETCFPIPEKRLRKRVIEHGLMAYLRDNTEAWEMRADGSYVRLSPDADEPFSAQQTLVTELS